MTTHRHFISRVELYCQKRGDKRHAFDSVDWDGDIYCFMLGLGVCCVQTLPPECRCSSLNSRANSFVVYILVIRDAAYTTATMHEVYVSAIPSRKERRFFCRKRKRTEEF
ncbi:hypothetical protein T4E_412 [Trichinella pseudospiralis]|uniref:Uncharacterized protein n=1 Tax=Trichinella pseudospiralis TaxID=6337 RepID=A0A0V0XZW5_TRIPS|nr:hypothetical protein T4E_412 [Trichinella pseudospiralis]